VVEKLRCVIGVDDCSGWMGQAASSHEGGGGVAGGEWGVGSLMMEQGGVWVVAGGRGGNHGGDLGECGGAQRVSPGVEYGGPHGGCERTGRVTYLCNPLSH